MLGIFAFILVFTAVPLPIAKASSSPYFSMTLVSPTSNPVRRQWAQIIQISYSGAGIAAHLVYMAFGQWLGILLGNTTCGKGGAPAALHVEGASPQNCPEPSFANGGWDAGFVGNGGGTVLPDFGTQNVVLYRGESSADFPPTGSNYYWWYNTTYNHLADDYSSNFSPQARQADAQQMVKIVADQRPGVIIEYPLEIYAFNPSFKPWGTTNAITSTTAGLDFQHWQTGSVSTVNVAVTGGLDAVNPLPNPTQNSFYDRYMYGPPTAAGLEEWDARGSGVYFNALASNIVTSADHLTYTVSLQTALTHKFQDGVVATADDYIFTNMASLIASTAYVGSGTLAGIEGTAAGYSVQTTFLNGTSDYVVNGNYYHKTAPAGFTATSVWKSLDANTYSFTLPAPYLFANPLITFVEGSALPMHIYEQLPFATWQSGPLSGFTGGCTGAQNIITKPCPAGGLSQNAFTVTWNAGRYGGNGSYKAYGPIADGAYVYHGYNAITQTATLVKFNGFWNATGLAALHEFTISTINIVSIPDKSAAEAAYGNPINFLDAQYTFNKDDATSLAKAGAFVAYVNDPANGWQEMPLNDALPIWGTGTGTPNGQSDAAHASTYAKDVRAALSFLVPRQSIVNNLLQGLGTVGVTEFFPTSGVISPGDIYKGVSADPLNVQTALAYLASAGYNTGVKPISQGGTIIAPPPINITGITLNVPNFFLGNSLSLAGGFPLVPAKTNGAGSFYVTLQQSFDGGTTWAPVALGTATSGGAYSLSYQPTSSGQQWYRVFFTGIAATYANGTAGPLRTLTVPGPALVESYDFPLATSPCGTLAGRGHTCAANMTDTQYSAPTSITAGTYSDLFTSLATGINNALKSLGTQTSASIATVNGNVQTLSNQLSSLSNSAAKATDVTALQNQVSSLNNTVNTLTDVSYAALAVAVILGLLAIALSRRKPS
jgi:ABC-type transport system substrate-binding protein